MKIRLDATLIKAKRLERRWSQEDFATIADVGVRTVQRAETTGVVSLETAKAFASVLEEDLSMLESQHSETTGPSQGARPKWGVWAGIASAMIGVAAALSTALEPGGLSFGAIAAFNEQTNGGLAQGAAGALAGLAIAAICFLIQRKRRV